MKCLGFFVVVIGLISCGTSKNTNRTDRGSVNVQSLSMERRAGENRIVFLTFGIWLQDSVKDEYGFTQKAVMYAEGRVKTSDELPAQYERYHLYWQAKDAKGRLMVAGKVPDPLFQSFETSDEHSGQMEKHLVTSQSGEIMIRFNLNDDTKVISIHKVSNGKLKKLYEAKLL